MRIPLTLLLVSLPLIVASQPVGAQDDQATRLSHQVHLTKANLTCITCHQDATTSTAATDANMPAERTCLACHTGDPLPKVDTSFLAKKQPTERTYRFNHEFHLQMGNVAPLIAEAIDAGSYLGKPGYERAYLDTENACQACHRGLEETDVAGKPNLPVMADCLVCHSDIRNPFSCETCHLEDVNLVPASHTRNFVDEHATGRLGFDKTTCLPCHGRNFACMGCH